MNKVNKARFVLFQALFHWIKECTLSLFSFFSMISFFNVCCSCSCSLHSPLAFERKRSLRSFLTFPSSPPISSRKLNERNEMKRAKKEGKKRKRMKLDQEVLSPFPFIWLIYNVVRKEERNENEMSQRKWKWKKEETNHSSFLGPPVVVRVVSCVVPFVQFTLHSLTIVIEQKTTQERHETRLTDRWGMCCVVFVSIKRVMDWVKGRKHAF